MIQPLIQPDPGVGPLTEFENAGSRFVSQYGDTTFALWCLNESDRLEAKGIEAEVEWRDSGRCRLVVTGLVQL